MKRFAAVIASVALLAMATGCAGPQGRIKGSEEGSLVGAKSAGAATYNQLVGETVEKLLKFHSDNANMSKRMVVAFVDIENRSAEELAENKEALYEEIDTIIVNSRAYTNVSRRYVDSALRASGLRVEDIFLGKGREKFTSVLREEGVAPDYLMWGKLTTLSTQGAQRREREYLLTLEMVDAATGITEAKQTAKVRKEYR